MADVWESLLHGCSAFIHSAAVSVVGTTASDTRALVGSLHDGARDANTKAALKKVKDDVETAAATGTALIDAVKPHLSTFATEIGKMGTELDAAFSWEGLARAIASLATAMTALDKAIKALADAAAAKEADPGRREIVRNDIRNITAPWAHPFLLAQQGMTEDFDELCRELFGLDDGTRKLGEKLDWDHDKSTITASLTELPGGDLGAIKLEKSELQAFFDFSGDALLGFRIKTTVTAELTSKGLLDHPLPGDAAKSEGVFVTLDTRDGLTFGEGKDRRMLLPIRVGGGNAELRNLTIARPEQAEGNGRIDVTATVAGKRGSVLAIVAEGLGVSLRWSDATGGALEVVPRPPDGMGIKVDAGIVKGGGYLRHREEQNDYGGALELKIGPVSATAVGLFTVDPSSFVIVIGLRFVPVIELSFGFTLNGLGGLLAIDRTLDPDALMAALADGVVSNLLFPDDPVGAAPTILQQLETVFPYREGAFVIGPIAELGWGSQSGLIRAKLGAMISIPGESPITLIGSVSLSVPPKLDEKNKFKLIDLNADIASPITADAFVTRIELRNSSLAKIPVSGSLGIYIGWASDAGVAFSAGGFYPGYQGPPMLGEMKRISIKLDPPIKGVTFNVSGYSAFTTNSVQWGGAAYLKAKIGPVSGEGSIEVNALFQWAPKLHFAYAIRASVSLKAFGHSVASVTFRGSIEGVHPWRLEGYAGVEFLWWEAELPVGPITWGEKNTELPPVVDAQDAVATALGSDSGWRANMPAGADQYVRLRVDPEAPPLIHPMATVDLIQQSVPLETEIDRIGACRTSVRRLYLAEPKIDALPAAAASELTELFPPGQFLNLSDDDKVARPDFEQFPAGVRIAASYGPRAGGEVDVAYQWETIFPHQGGLRRDLTMQLTPAAAHILNSGVPALAVKKRGNPYLPPRAEPVTVLDPGLKTVRDLDTLATVGAAELITTTTAAREAEAMIASGARVQIVGMGMAS